MEDSAGFIISETTPQYSPSYPLIKDIAQAGEENGFSFALCLSCLRVLGDGGPTGFWDDALEAMTEMAALSRDTKFMKLIGSVNILAIHPAIAARMAMPSIRPATAASCSTSCRPSLPT